MKISYCPIAPMLLLSVAAFLARPAAAQDMYVLNSAYSTGSPYISRISPTGAVTNIALNGGSGISAENLAMDSMDNFYVSYDNNVISKFDSEGNAIAFNLTGDNLSGPLGLVFDKAGNLYAANGNNGTISKITPTGVVSTFASGGSLDVPFFLAFNKSGALYSTSLVDSSISKFDGAGNAVSFPALNGGGLTDSDGLLGVAFDAQGSLLVTNGNYGAIVRVDPT